MIRVVTLNGEFIAEKEQREEHGVVIVVHQKDSYGEIKIARYFIPYQNIQYIKYD